ncbi:MAG: fumarylacetoacetate hydrolase family protein [Actinobacteria bacterium]|nr:fumarylacetoacetate hydrolase family protein [Actinomycetota bacterium]
MRLVSYRADETLRPGVIIDDDVFDVGRLLGAADGDVASGTGSVKALLETHGEDLPGLAATLQDAAADTSAAKVGPRAEVALGPPVPDAAKVLCIGINYKGHATETKRELPKFPDVFCKFASSLVGPTDDMQLTGVSPKMDYEVELAVVIGRPCRNVAAAEAIDKVAGAMVLNDTSARDLQFNATQWTPGKAIDDSTPCGPALVTLDEIGDLQALELATRVNGEERQRSDTSRMIFTVAEIIAYISTFLQLNPGDVISTGTPEGIGSRMDPPTFLAAGDEVEVEVEGLGTLRNTVR